MKIIHSVFPTPFGWCGIVKGEAGLVRIFLPEPEKSSVDRKIKLFYPLSVFSKGSFSNEIRKFERYFAGSKPHFSFTLDFSGSTLFQTMVWSEAGNIPYGEVKTYGWIAERIGKPRAVRAVGNTLGRNPFPIIIPCHRVIRESGELGGFSTPVGTELKAKLLQLERVRFKFGVQSSECAME
jgi:methylated-DNA-[protein]-cysteine S-methyltransferase